MSNKNFCVKCQSLFEGKTYGKDKLCGDCNEVLTRLGFPVTAELDWSKVKKKKAKKKVKGK